MLCQGANSSQFWFMQIVARCVTLRPINRCEDTARTKCQMPTIKFRYNLLEIRKETKIRRLGLVFVPGQYCI